MIQQNRLIIRKTYNPNHAKLYLFKLDKSQIGKSNLFITGSSNLTKAGLSTQDEFNVEIGDYGFEEANDYFDALWDDAVKITEYDDIRKKLLETIEKETLVKEISPFEAFVLSLKTYLESYEEKEIGESLAEMMEKNGYSPYQYQLDAVGQALSIIENNNGVIVADVVGLGKTVIACAIAKCLKKRGIIISPPGLVGDKNKNSGWKKYAEEFGLYDWEVRSLGDLENTLEFVNKAKDIEAVIIDEAHRFRNKDTKDYELLKNICRGKTVILLTATPFNNRPDDILALLKLFVAPKKSSITLGNNLAGKFKGFKTVFEYIGYIKKNWNSLDSLKRARAGNYYKALFGEKDIDIKKADARASKLASEIRDVIEPVTIRRNRLDLKNNPFYKDEIKELSKVADPIEWYFELTGEQSEFYSEIIETYFASPDDGGKFRGAIYRPFEYEKVYKKEMSEDENRQFQQQRNLFDFMRCLIVKRFESSFGAFEQSMRNFKKITEDILQFIKKTGNGDIMAGKFILDRSLLEKIYDRDEDEIEQSLLEYEEIIKKGEKPKNHKIYEIRNFKEKEKFISDIQSDLKLFDEILGKLKKLNLVKNDPKTAFLIENIKKEFGKGPNKGEPERKIIIFTEYKDTVHYLKKALERNYGDKILVIDGNLASSKVLEINKNFDALYEAQENRFKIMLATDKISEGFNLNRAGMVINYDIPWNPVRVIQRLGRINRISRKVFENLYIVNFFPTEKGAELVKSREIAANKMFLIHTALGEDSKIFDAGEEPTPAGLFRRIQQSPDEMEQESFYTKALREFLKIKKEDPELIENLKNYPPRIKSAKKHGENELFVFFKKGRMFVIGARTDAEKIEPYQTSFEEVFDKITCEKGEKALVWNTDNFWKIYDAIQNFKSYRAGLANEQSLEQKALNNLSYLINMGGTSNLPLSQMGIKGDLVHIEEIMPHKNFMRELRDDILNYGTLSDYTLRRIANFKEDGAEKILELKNELGEDYLIKEKRNLKEQKKEIIIAIENKK
ncbi:MAG: helicase-related protein [bacterium]